MQIVGEKDRSAFRGLRVDCLRLRALEACIHQGLILALLTP